MIKNNTTKYESRTSPKSARRKDDSLLAEFDPTKTQTLSTRSKRTL